MSNVVSEFSRFAYEYDTYNIIQAEVARELISMLSKNKYKTIIDFGCGSGAVYRNLEQQKIVYDSFVALDSSSEMLSIHPDDSKTYKIHTDFNTEMAYQKFSFRKDDTILISASALQWSQDLNFVFSRLATLASKAHFAIFTSGTFRTLHKIAKIESPIYAKEHLEEVVLRYYDAAFELHTYKLEFKTVREMFQYIKRSGVSGGKKKLGYTEMKLVMRKYPLNYLEFEVLFVKASSLIV